jgi:hypothetical protein
MGRRAHGGDDPFFASVAGALPALEFIAFIAFSFLSRSRVQQPSLQVTPDDHHCPSVTTFFRLRLAK